MQVVCIQTLIYYSFECKLRLHFFIVKNYNQGTSKRHFKSSHITKVFYTIFIYRLL